VGCAGYRLGTVAPIIPPGSQIAVPPVANKTTQPYLTEPITAALRKAIQLDGTFRLADSRSADYILEIEIVRYERRAISYSPVEVVAGVDYELIATAQAKLYQCGSKDVVWSGSARGTTIIRSGEDFSASERRGVDILAENLARHIVHKLSKGGW